MFADHGDAVEDRASALSRYQITMATAIGISRSRPSIRKKIVSAAMSAAPAKAPIRAGAVSLICSIPRRFSDFVQALSRKHAIAFNIAEADLACQR